MIFDGYWRLELAQSRMRLKFYHFISKFIYSEYLHHKVNKEILLSAAAIRKITDDELEFKNSDYYNTPHYPMPYKTVRVDEEGNPYLEEPTDVDFKKPLDPPELAILDSVVTLVKYPFIGDESFILNKPILEDYDQSRKEIVKIPLREVCNQIIHSYVWGTITRNGKEVYGILMVSDRKKKEFIYLLELKEWMNVLETCAFKSTV